MASTKMSKIKKKKDDRLVKIGELIRERRKMLGLTQEELAEAVDVSVATVGVAEQGVHPISIDVAVKISEKLNISLDYMLEPLKTIKPDDIEGRKSVELCYACEDTRGIIVKYAEMIVAAFFQGGIKRKKKK